MPASSPRITWTGPLPAPPPAAPTPAPPLYVVARGTAQGPASTGARLMFGGTVYPCPPAPALALLDLQAKARQAVDSPRALRALLGLLWRLATGDGLAGWIARACRRNPFRTATASEVAHLVAFFLSREGTT